MSRRGIYAAYIRVSRRGDRDELRSPDFQRQAIDAYASREGFQVDWLEPEIDVSGSKASRPILDAALERIEAGELAGLVVWRLDRLSRLPAKQRVELFDRIDQAGGSIKSTQEQLDPSTPEGRFTRDVFLGIARMQWERYQEGWDVAKAAALDRGIHIAATPVGYARAKGCPLELDPARAPLVRELFERRARGQSWRSLAGWLAEQPAGYRTTSAAIIRIVTNRVYLGEARGRGKSVKVDAHPAIVDVELFAAAQVRQPRPARSKAASPALLTGIIRCAGCGHTMSVTSTKDAAGKAFRYYSCRKNAAAGVCPAPSSIGVARIEPVVERVVLGHLRDHTAEAHDRLRELDSAVAFQRRTRDELAAYVANEAALGEHFMAGFEQRQRVAAEADTRVSQLQATLGPNVAQSVTEDVWPTLNPEERRTLVRGALGLVWVRKGRGRAEERVRIVATGFEPSDLPARGFGRTARTLRPLSWADDLPGEIPVTRIEDADERPKRAAA